MNHFTPVHYTSSWYSQSSSRSPEAMPAVLREQEQLCTRCCKLQQQQPLHAQHFAAGISVCWGTPGLGQEQWMLSSAMASKMDKNYSSYHTRDTASHWHLSKRKVDLITTCLCKYKQPYLHTPPAVFQHWPSCFPCAPRNSLNRCGREKLENAKKAQCSALDLPWTSGTVWILGLVGSGKFKSA